MDDTNSGTIEIEVAGKRYEGHYTVTAGKLPLVWVTAATPAIPGIASAPVGSESPATVAAKLLRERVLEARASGALGE